MERQELSAVVKRTLRDIEESKLDELVCYLLGKGVKRERDLRHFTIAMLETQLDLIDASNLHEEWQKLYSKFHFRKVSNDLCLRKVRS